MYWLILASVLAGAIAFFLVVSAYRVPKKKIGTSTKLRRSRESVAWRLALAVLFAVLAWWTWPSSGPASSAPTETEDPVVASEDSSGLAPSTEPKPVPPKSDSGSKDSSKEPPKPVPKRAPLDMSSVAKAAEKLLDTTTTWWKHWGAAPYASSYASVCKNMPATINGFRRMPVAVKQEFIQMLGSNCAGGEEIYITPDMRFWEMWTGGANPYPMQNVAVDKVAVTHSSDGRPLREVFQTARGRKWTIEHEGRTYTLVIPYVCNNVAYMVSESDCVTVVFNANKAFPGGTASFGVASVNGPLPASSCNAIKQGDGLWLAPYGECPSCPPPFSYLTRVFGENVKVPHRYLFGLTASVVYLRFPRAVWEKGVYICLTTAEGVTSCGVYILPGTGPGQWAGRNFIQIDDVLWVWGSCPD